MKMSVISKIDKQIYEVFDITYDNCGYPHFLIYQDNQWVCMSAKYFRPMNTEDFKALLDTYDHQIMAI